MIEYNDIDVENIINMDRVKMNAFLNAMDRIEMERVIRAFVAWEKKRQLKKITLTPEQFEMHFRLSEKSGKRGRPSIIVPRPEELLFKD